ncbi:unnamed protein product [Phaeothamnion confervicola]
MPERSFASLLAGAIACLALIGAVPAEASRWHSQWARLAFNRGIYPADPNEPWLIEFTGYNCDHCDTMEPLVERLEKEFKVPVEQFIVWEGSSKFDLMQLLDTVECRGLPFFYNRRSRQAICGATSWRNFRNWGLGKKCKVFAPPIMTEEQERALLARPTKPSIFSKMRRRIEKVKEQGQKEMTKRVEQKDAKGATE